MNPYGDAPTRRGRRARGWHHLDAVTFLTVYLVLLFCIESRFVLPGLGAGGSPALLVGGAGFVWWVFYHAQRPVTLGLGRQPLRIALLLVLGAFVASYVAAMARPIAPLETGTANIGVVGLVSVVGVGLLAHDGITTRERFDRLVGRLVLLTGALAALGIAQFLANDPLVRSFEWPLLVPNTPLGGLTLRSGFSRPFGTALHPIEFGAVITTVLPLAITRAVNRTHTRVRGWLPVGLMAIAVLLSISRSALVCGLAGLVVLGLGWGARARRALLAGVVTAFAVVAVAVPGMLGSLAALFATAGDDGSVTSRTESYPLALEFFGTAPLFGRGYSTFLPMYRIFDNEYLLLLVETGLVGLAAVVGLLVTACVCAVRSRRRSDDPELRGIFSGLLAAVIAAGLGLAFYDGFSFPVATGVLFLVIGLVGSLRRLVVDGETSYDESHRFVGVLARSDRAAATAPRRHRLRLGSQAVLAVALLALPACSAVDGADPVDPVDGLRAEPSTPAALPDWDVPEEWPGPATTGASGPLSSTIGTTVVSTDGAVLQDLVVRGTLTIRADDVTVSNVLVRANSYYGILVYGRGTTIEDTTVTGTNPDTMAGIAAIEPGTFSATRVEVTAVEDGVRLASGCELRDSLVHGLAGDPASHFDGVTADGGYTGWRIIHNTILNPHGQTGAVWVGDARYGPSEGEMRDNYVAGGGYTVYAGPGTGRGIRVIGNEFSTRYHEESGRWGVSSRWDPQGNAWLGNVWADGPRRGRPVQP